MLSLVLSYIPDPYQRTQAVLKARQLLRDPEEGGGLLLIVTPHSSDRRASKSSGLEPRQAFRAGRE